MTGRAIRGRGGSPSTPRSGTGRCDKHDEAYKIQSQPDTKNQARPGLYGCAACRKTFTATVGTVLEDSHIPISKWLIAIFILCSSKKSVSANQLHRMLGVTYKTAWFMAHRIRFAMTPNLWAEPKLKGTVEVDEAFVGGKGDGVTRFTRQGPVVALVERGGMARVKVVASVTQKNLGAALQECVDPSAVVNTDEHPGYKKPLKAWQKHNAVNHSQGEYQRKNADGSIASIHTAESNALTPEERLGFKTFTEAGCQMCHSGALLGGTSYQRLGAMKPYPRATHPGRMKVTNEKGDRWVFKVPSLRNVEKTGPYFHDGETTSLEQAVRDMAEYQLGKTLTDQQAREIVDFLKVLTGKLDQEYIKPPVLPPSTAKTPKPEVGN